MYMLLTEDDENNEKPMMEVAIDLQLTAHSNSESYYNIVKQASEKQKKTEAISLSIIKKAENRAKSELLQIERKEKEIQIMRTLFWFEKFYWFITSENYLVMMARAPQESDILINKHLQSKDLLFHSDINGANVSIIKNPTGKKVSPISIQEAGINEVCRSSAWEQKLVAGVYWVYGYQISKLTPNGQKLESGKFIIKGKKNYINPYKMEMGVGILYCVSDASAAKHSCDRKLKTDNLEDVIIEQVDLQINNEESKMPNNEIMNEEQIIERIAKLDSIKNNENSYEVSKKIYELSIQLNNIKKEKKKNKRIKKEEANGKDKEQKEVKENKEQDHKANEKDEDNSTKEKKGKKEFKNKTKEGKEKGKEKEKEETKKDEQKVTDKAAKRQKKKLKKVKQKYGDQDEEEKQTRMLLMGSKSIKATNEQKDTKEEEKEEEEGEGKELPTKEINEGKKEIVEVAMPAKETKEINLVKEAQIEKDKSKEQTTNEESKVSQSQDKQIIENPNSSDEKENESSDSIEGTEVETKENPTLELQKEYSKTLSVAESYTENEVLF